MPRGSLRLEASRGHRMVGRSVDARRSTQRERHVRRRRASTPMRGSFSRAGMKVPFGARKGLRRPPAAEVSAEPLDGGGAPVAMHDGLLALPSEDDPRVTSTSIAGAAGSSRRSGEAGPGRPVVRRGRPRRRTVVAPSRSGAGPRQALRPGTRCTRPPVSLLISRNDGECLEVRIGAKERLPR